MAQSLVYVGQLLIVISVLVQLSASLPAQRRFERHADGLFTSEFSKIKNDVAMRSLLKSLLISKRSVEEPHFLNIIEEEEPGFEKVCFAWLYQSFLNDSLSDNDALETTQITHRSICPAMSHLLSDLGAYLPKSMKRK